MAISLPSTMRAVQWSSSVGGIENNMGVHEVPLPKDATSLPRESTLVEVAYSTLNPVDYKMPEIPVFGRTLNRIPCSDFAGTVVSTTLPNFKRGDSVFGMTTLPAFGALAEYTMVTGSQGIMPVPDGVSLRDASALGVAALIAYQCIVPFANTGDKVFINGGSGGVGTFGIQIAKAMGCYVTATCSGPNVELCKNLGADEVIDYRSVDVIDHLKREGTQYAVLFDTVFTPAIYWSAHQYLKPSGVYTTIPGEPSFSTIRSMAVMFLLPKFLGGGQRTLKLVRRQLNAAHYAEIAEWMKEGKVRTVVEREYGLGEAAEAFSRLKTGRTRGKLVISVAREQ